MADSIQTDTLVSPDLDTEQATTAHHGFVDFDPADTPQPCSHCHEWRSEIVQLSTGPVLREWHETTCQTYVDWAD